MDLLWRGLIVLVLPAVLQFAPAFGQTFLYQVGDSTTTNLTTTYPCPYGNFQDDSRHQMLFLASEMIAEGMLAGDINSIALKVDIALNTNLNNYTVEMGTTTLMTLPSNFQGGLTQVWGPAVQNASTGWNTHMFATPFFWDGTSNIIVQTCNNNFNNSQNPIMVLGATPFVSTLFALTNTGNICGGGLPPTPTTSSERPIIQFGLDPDNDPPVANFSPQNVTSCSGVIQFTDLTSFMPTNWLWDFGDATTDTTQNPLHTYSNDGSYTVSLIVTNVFGMDTLIIPNAVTVSVSSPQPVPACIPTTSGALAGIGILQVDLEDVSESSGDGQTEGYADRGCVIDTVLAGSVFNTNIITGAAAAHNVRVWVDWNNNAVFATNELMLSGNSVNNFSGNITVPGTAVLNTPIRMRIVADYELSPIPTPCGNPQYGQAEDYGLVIIPNTQPPVAAFSGAPLVSCDGVVQFTDASQNVPTTWQWDFGDTNTSPMQNPQHTYAASGTYTVTLITSNANGSDTETLVDLITVNLNASLTAASCTPTTSGYCCGYGILDVQFVDIMNTSTDGAEGYQDFSCAHHTDVTEGLTYPISVQTGTQNAQDVLIWLDANNDGSFTAAERIFTATNVFNATGNITIPAGAVLNTPLRMRISSDGVGNIANACSAPAFAQVEDYGITVLENTAPPVAGFTANPTVTCNGMIQFTDQSINIVQGWMWYFGDGMTSSMQNPMYTYGAPGTYTVSLVVSNAFGSDSIAIVDMIQYVGASSCDTSMVTQGDQMLTECFGIITDNGGPNGNYTPGANGVVTIAPPGAQSVTLTFSQFEFQPNDDYLLIFDGPNAGSPLIGQFDGFGVTSLPNGGVITSSGGAISLQQDIAFGFQFFDGFIANWECTPIGIEELAANAFQLWPNPANGQLNITWDELEAPVHQLQIVNGLGEVVRNITMSSVERRYQVDVRDWASGLYSLIANTDRGTWTGSFIVE